MELAPRDRLHAYSPQRDGGCGQVDSGIDFQGGTIFSWRIISVLGVQRIYFYSSFPFPPPLVAYIFMPMRIYVRPYFPPSWLFHFRTKRLSESICERGCLLLSRSSPSAYLSHFSLFSLSLSLSLALGCNSARDSQPRVS